VTIPEMLDANDLNSPSILKDIQEATTSIGFTMGSDLLTGSLLRTLAATKPAGTFLELGTGSGLGTAWILDGMDAQSRLITVDRDEHTSAVARRLLGPDARVQFLTMDGIKYIASIHESGKTFDLIFADMQPGKFAYLDETLESLKVGGIYMVDDLLPLPSWEEQHAARVVNLIRALEQRQDLRITKLNWSTGLLIAIKTR
jgi:predicted O-methyltransferase YrrM